MSQRRTPYRDHLPFAVLTTAAVAASAAVWFGMPHQRSIANVGVLLVKLVPFVLAVEAIAQLRAGPAARRRIAMAAIPVCFMVYFGYFVPRIFFEEGRGEDGVYYLLLTVTPFLILALVLAYRLGGGSAGRVRRLAYAMMLLQLSGLEDLAYILVNPHTDPDWASIPPVWVWADHMTVFVGRPLTKNEAFVFIAIHLALALLVLLLPDRLWPRPVRREPATRAHPAAPPSTAGDGYRAETDGRAAQGDRHLTARRGP